MDMPATELTHLVIPVVKSISDTVFPEEFEITNRLRIDDMLNSNVFSAKWDPVPKKIRKFTVTK